MAADPLLAKVASHFFTDEFQSVIDEFIRRNCRAFVDVTDEQIDGAENKLEYVTFFMLPRASARWSFIVRGLVI